MDRKMNEECTVAAPRPLGDEELSAVSGASFFSTAQVYLSQMNVSQNSQLVYASVASAAQFSSTSQSNGASIYIG
jgi:hypothetical protein